MIRKRSTASSIRRLCDSASSSDDGAGELQQVVLALGLVADLERQRTRMPVVLALHRSTAGAYLRLDVRDDLGATLFLDGHREHEHEVVYAGGAAMKSALADGRRPTIAGALSRRFTAAPGRSLAWHGLHRVIRINWPRGRTQFPEAVVLEVLPVAAASLPSSAVITSRRVTLDRCIRPLLRYSSTRDAYVLSDRRQPSRDRCCRRERASRERREGTSGPERRQAVIGP